MKLLASSALILVVSAAIFPIFQGKFYATGDTRDVFIPLETFFRHEQLAGRLPAWNPDISWGFPVIASAQIGFFYPPLLLTRFLPIWLYLPLNLVAHLAFTAIGTFLFLRKLNRSPSASYLGAISFTLGAFVFQHLTHLNVIFALAWFPWQLFALQKVALSKRSESKSNIVWLSLTLGIPFFAGQIQVPLLIVAVSTAYFLWLTCLPVRQAWQRKQKIAKSLSTIILAGLLAFGLAAAQLFPTAELAWHSTRGKNNDFNIERANQYSWPLYHLPTLVFPRFFGNDDTYWGKKLQVEYGFFIGTVPLLLALYAFFLIRDPSLRFFKWLLVISFLLALGSLSPFRLLRIEPSLWIFSGPARWLLLTTFSLSVTAAYAWDKSFPTLTKGRWLPWAAGGVLVGVLLSNLALFALPDSFFQAAARDAIPTRNSKTFTRPSSYYQEKLTSLLSSARSSSISLLSPYTALPIVLLGAAPFLFKRQYGKRLLLAATTAELIILAATANPALSWQKILTPPDTLAQIPSAVLQKQARVFSLRDFEDVGALLTSPEGRNAFRLHEEPRELLLPLIHAQFNLPGVAWPASLDLTEQSTVLHELSKSLQRNEVDIAQELNVGTVLSNTTATRPAIVTIQTLDPKPRASLILQDSTEIAAEYRELSPTHIKIETQSSEPGTLIIRDTYYPGWRARVDERPVSIVQSQRIFRSISIPAGKHTMEMRYQPISLYRGLALSGVSLIIISFTILRSRRKLAR